MFPVSFFEQQCKDIFGDKFTVELLENGVNFTNTYYGAQGLRPSRVIFPNGSIDPWHALGITANTQVGWKSQAVYINGTAHCADSYPSSSDDLAQLTEAREQILTFLQNSLSDD
ncbi:putative serine protease K12H4.7 [Halotydeus destructor]|nr:putative serine protease K12H4.7 [Halotydeus destructor]